MLVADDLAEDKVTAKAGLALEAPSFQWVRPALGFLNLELAIECPNREKLSQPEL